ncbi:15111_t:CDS:2 [Racocetra fulgida]|uniref:15111_t:CDS:1 n=1 Tax=Racocetra fulgida TaxID=60492 RepID=A0A9N9AUY0_9GLOM|nr:15111_t:CDS:2 [Racocetra fulgida]
MAIVEGAYIGRVAKNRNIIQLRQKDLSPSQVICNRFSLKSSTIC